MTRCRLAICLFVAFLAFPPVASAALIDLGDGTIFSTEMGRAFLSDLNAAQTTGFDADGNLTWAQAMAWIAHLNSTRYLGYDNWELASGPDPLTLATSARTTHNYLERLIYGELGNLRPAVQPPSGYTYNLGPFTNFPTHAGTYYWVAPFAFGEDSCGPVSPDPLCLSILYNPLQDAYQGDFVAIPGAPYRALAMRSVPEPSTLALITLGAAVAAIRRRRARTH